MANVDRERMENIADDFFDVIQNATENNGSGGEIMAALALALISCAELYQLDMSHGYHDIAKTNKYKVTIVEVGDVVS